MGCRGTLECHLHFARVLQAIAHYSLIEGKVECCNVILNYKLQCYYIYLCFSTYVPRKISEKNYTLFTREICNIRSEDRFYLERTDFGKKIHKREIVNLGEKLFFRDHIILVAEIKDRS